jgi:hypothetical protein
MYMAVVVMVMDLTTLMATILAVDLSWEDHNLDHTDNKIMHTGINLMLLGVLVETVLEIATVAQEGVKAS